MKQALLLFSFLAFSSGIYAQHEYGSFSNAGRGASTTFATDYQSLGINPANLGWTSPYNKRFTMGFAEMTYSVHSEALTRQELRKSVGMAIRGDKGAFTYDEKMNAARDFTNSGFAINVDGTSFGFAFSSPKLGGIAFRINDRFQWYSRLGQTASEILFMGFNAPYFDSLQYYNGSDTVVIPNGEYSQDTLNNIVNGFTNIPRYISQIMDGSVLTMSWVREWNLSYGRKIIGNDSVFALYAGVGVKYFQGMAYLDVSASGGNLNAFSSFSPLFNIDYGSAALSNPSAITGGNSFLPRPVGHGWGMDVGVNVVIGGRLKLGASVSNLGSMTWNGNAYTMNDTLVYDINNAGLNSFNLLSQIDEIAGESGMFSWDGVASKKVSLPTVYRFGASMKLGKIVEAGVDLILPGNDVAGNFDKAIIGLGGDVTPIKWLRISAGMLTGGNYPFRIPVGITFVSGKGTWEGGIASRDAVTFFARNGPTLSLSTGFLRYRF